ncbi:MAG: hypothetical protein EBU90_09890 [Proteobacteria bacterium]|nr:hypothetical protein [Pseudomonadota bacterium]
MKAKTFIDNKDEEGLKKYEEENLPIIEERKKQIDQVNAKLEETASIELVLIEEEIIPKDLSADQLASLRLIIKK